MILIRITLARTGTGLFQKAWQSSKMSRGYERFHHGGPGGHTDPKAMRSIFIANVAFETTEEQLRSVLSEVKRSVV